MHRRLIYFVGRCDRTLPLLYGRWHGEAVTEGLKFIKCRKFTVIGGMRHAALRRETKECRTILFVHAKSKFLQKYFNRNKFFFAFFYNVPCPV